LNGGILVMAANSRTESIWVLRDLLRVREVVSEDYPDRNHVFIELETHGEGSIINSGTGRFSSLEVIFTTAKGGIAEYDLVIFYE
jgi:hypothetical protein